MTEALRFPTKRLIALAALVIAVPFAWWLLDLPPVRLVLKYGLPPAGGPTDETRYLAGLTFIELSPGYYRHEGETGGRWVEIERPIWVAANELTNESWALFDEGHAKDLDPRLPVTRVPYGRVLDYCNWLSSEGDLTVRPPTEEEWEYACRAGSTSVWSCGDDPEELGNSAWFAMTAAEGPQPVMTREPSRFDLYDFHGNVAEWCSDAAPPEPGGPKAIRRVVRGGHYASPAAECASSARSFRPETEASRRVGFRPFAVAGE